MPPWPFGKRLSDAGNSRPPSALDEIEADTPRRFRVLLADAERNDAALEVLRSELGGELVAEASMNSEGRIEIEIASRFSPESAAVMRPLNVLKAAGIAVSRLELSGLVTAVGSDALARAVEDWGTHGNQGPYRRRLERLAGTELLERCLAGMRRAPRSGPGSTAHWRFTVGCVAFNTPGAERRLLLEAVDERNALSAEYLVGDAEQRARLAALGSQPIDVPAEALAELIGRHGALVSERASFLAMQMPAPLPDSVTRALCAVAVGDESGERVVRAVAALRRAEPTPATRGAIETALRSDNTNVRGEALGTFAHHWGIEARPVWQAFLASKSAPERWAAEAVLGIHGTEDDLADAAAHLAKLARAKASVYMSPPRGNEIVDLLVRHRDDRAARAGLDDLSARWDRLGADLRDWLAAHHPWLDPAVRSERAVEAQAEPEETLAWPPPEIERDGDTLTLWWDEGAAHTDARERFEELATAHPSVEVLDGDREWLSVRIADSDPDGLVQQLWDAAGGGEAG